MSKQKKIFHLLFSQTKEFIFYTIFSIVSALSVIFEVIIVKNYIDKVIVFGNHADTSFYVGLFLAGLVGFVSSIILRSSSKTILCSNIAIELTKEAYDAVLYADINEFSKEDNYQKTLKILENSDDIANKYFRHNFLKMYESLISVIILFISMLIIEPILSLFVLIGFPIYYVINRGLQMLINRVYNKNAQSIKKINYIIENDFNNIRSIKLMNSAEFEKANLDDNLEIYKKSKINKYLASNISGKALQVSFNSLIVAVILGLCGFLSADSGYGITSGKIISFLVLVPYTFYNFNTLVSCSFKTTTISKQIDELLDVCKIKTERRSEPVSSLEEIHSIKFTDVCYTNLRQ